MEPKEGVGGRLGQSFDILKKDFIKLGLPIFVYNFLSFAFVGAVVMVLAFKMLKGMDFNSTDWISFYSNPKTIIALSTSIVLFIVYLIAYIPVTLGLFKGIKQSIAGKEITVKENLLYGVSRLLSAFKTYWYIFAYVALIPALMFILAGLLIIVGYIAEIGALVSIGGIIMSISMIVFLVFALLRGIKSTFAIYSAVDSDQFTKENFEASIKSTDGNWWRIVGNFLLAGLVVWLISFIGTIIFSFIPFAYTGTNSFESTEDLLMIIENFSFVSHMVGSFFELILSTIITVLMTSFIYLLFLRLRTEVNLDGSTVSTETKQETTQEVTNEL